MVDELNPTETMKIRNLDKVVLDGLDFLAEVQDNNAMPDANLEFKMPLLVGSGLAINTLRIMYGDRSAVTATESNYQTEFKKWKGIDGIVIASASGGKHAPGLAAWAGPLGIPTVLITCNPITDAAKYVNKTIVIPSPSMNARDKIKNPNAEPEPLTYNFATYVGMMMAKSGENARAIKKYIQNEVNPVLERFGRLNDYEAFFGVVPNSLGLLAERGIVKFQELFSQQYGVDFCAEDDSKHAKTLVPTLESKQIQINPETGAPIEYKKELFLNFGGVKPAYGPENQRLNIPLPNDVDYATATSILYYVVGKIQESHPQMFKLNCAGYTKEQTKMFGKQINIIQDFHYHK